MMSDTYKNQEYISCYGYDRITKNHSLRDPAWYIIRVKKHETINLNKFPVRLLRKAPFGTGSTHR
jgi:hypothetical protein